MTPTVSSRKPAQDSPSTDSQSKGQLSAGANRVRRRIERGFVDLRDDVAGDVEVIGGQANIYSTVHGDVVVRGGRVTVHGVVTGDVINDGGHVVVLGEVGGRVSGSREYTIVDRSRRKKRAARTAPPSAAPGAAESSGLRGGERNGRPVRAVLLGVVALVVLAASGIAGWRILDGGGAIGGGTEVAGAVELPKIAGAPVTAPFRSDLDTSAFDRPVLPAAEPVPNCHPSYYPCVPFAANVRCAKAELPEGTVDDDEVIVARPVGVVGPDVYGLDPDGDGVGCDQR